MKIIKEFSQKLKSFSFASLLNKYAITVIIFIVWLCFFDRYNMINQIKLSHNVKMLQRAKADYEVELQNALKEREVFNKDIEKYAREKYLFHKDNEKVILIK